MGLIIGAGNTKPVFPYDYYYGVRIKTTVADTALERVGRAELHASLPVQSGMRRCLLDDEGNVVTYLHATDSTKTDTGAAAANNCDFADQLLQAGIAKDTGFYKASGFCTYPLWVFDEQFLRSCGEENYEKYSSRFDEYMKDTLDDHEYDDESEDEGEDESIGMNM